MIASSRFASLIAQCSTLPYRFDDVGGLARKTLPHRADTRLMPTTQRCSTLAQASGQVSIGRPPQTTWGLQFRRGP